MPARPKLIGTYRPPPVKRGDVVTCLYRECDCKVTGFHDGKIVWPRVKARGVRGGSGLWVNEDLVRAIQTESAAALMYWFGVSSKAVWNWRKAFGVSGTATVEGSHKAHRAASQAGAEGIKRKDWTEEETDRKAETAKQAGMRPTRWTPATGAWMPEEEALLGTDHDHVIATSIGRTVQAVTSHRTRLGIWAFSGNPTIGRPWTPDELAKLGMARDEDVAPAIGLTARAVKLKRCELGIPIVADRRLKGNRLSETPRVKLKWIENGAR